MKKFIKILSALLAITIILAGCSAKSTDSNDAKGNTTDSTGSNNKTAKLIVGATSVPHAEILNLVKPALKEKGIELEVKEISDYAIINPSLNDKQLDANFFQHLPYLEEFNKSKNANLVPVAKVHVEPMAAYSQKLKSKNELKDGSLIAIPNDATNEGRALLLLQKQGLIKLKDQNALTQTPRDIVDNPKNLKFKELEAAQLPRVLKDVDLAVINTNYALEAKLNPASDALFVEDKDSPYANILVARPDNKDSKAIQELAKALNTEEVKKFLEERYKGAIVPAF